MRAARGVGVDMFYYMFRIAHAVIFCYADAEAATTATVFFAARR